MRNRILTIFLLINKFYSRKNDKSSKMNKNNNIPIHINTEKPFYYPGDTVCGHILLNFESSNFPGNQLIFKIKGKEETSWNSTNAHDPSLVDKKTGLIIFYNHRFPFHIWNEGFVPAGQYDFPFSFNLKDFLPGSYSHKGDLNDQRTKTTAVVKYMLKAECLAMDYKKEMSKIKCSRELFVREKKANIFSKGEILLPMSSCLCISQGSCQIRCYFEKNAYESGENANVFCEIDNTGGSKSLENLSFELKNQIILRTDDGETKEYNSIICKKEMQGIASGQKAEGPNKKAISVSLTPSNLNQTKDYEEVKMEDDDNENQNDKLQESSTGQLINSSYFLEVLAKSSGTLTCSSQKTTKIPVMIFKKPKANKKMQGEWNPKVMETTNLVITEANFYRKSNK